jgi:hypothetical protein
MYTYIIMLHTAGNGGVFSFFPGRVRLKRAAREEWLVVKRKKKSTQAMDVAISNNDEGTSKRRNV